MITSLNAFLIDRKLFFSQMLSDSYDFPERTKIRCSSRWIFYGTTNVFLLTQSSPLSIGKDVFFYECFWRLICFLCLLLWLTFLFPFHYIWILSVIKLDLQHGFPRIYNWHGSTHDIKTLLKYLWSSKQYFHHILFELWNQI